MALELRAHPDTHRFAEEARLLAVQVQDYLARGLKSTVRYGRRSIRQHADHLIRRRYYEALAADREAAL